jgi:hypothetical protein
MEEKVLSESTSVPRYQYINKRGRKEQKGGEEGAKGEKRIP